MPPTIASLLADKSLNLRLLTQGGTAGDTTREVRWVHTTELNDPAPFLEGGELLLTTGMRFADDEFDVDTFLSGLVVAGVSGLGFGVGLANEAVPEQVVAAAEVLGLPVLEVPKATPFIAIAKAVSRALAAEEYRALAEGYRTQQELIKAALLPNGQNAVVRGLVRGLGADAWAVLYNAEGTVLLAAGETPDGLDLPGELRQMRGRTLPTSTSISTAAGHVEIHALGAQKRILGFLAVGIVGRTSGPDVTGRQILTSGLTLLTLGMEQPQVGLSQSVYAAEQALRRAVLRLLTAGYLEAGCEAAAELQGSLPQEPVRVWRSVTSALPEEFPDGLLLADFNGETVVVASADAATEAELARLLGGGVSDRVVYGDLGRAYRQAGQALAASRSSGRTPVFFSELGSGLAGLFADQAVRDFAAGLLRPLLEQDKTGLVPTLRAWLAHNGQWDAAAAELGVHRHTVRARIARAGELLNRDLTAADSADVRMELWFALRVHSEG